MATKEGAGMEKIKLLALVFSVLLPSSDLLSLTKIESGDFSLKPTFQTLVGAQRGTNINFGLGALDRMVLKHRRRRGRNPMISMRRNAIV